MKKNPNIGSTVFVIDDDASLRAALKELFESVGLQVELFGSGESFLERKHSNSTCCLVLDIRLPGMSGLKCQEELANAKISIPIIFLTGHGDIPMAVRAMKSGAVDFLTKPFRNQDLPRRGCRGPGTGPCAAREGGVALDVAGELQIAQPARARCGGPRRHRRI